MAWRNWFRRRAEENQRGSVGEDATISLRDEQSINLGRVRDLYALLAAIDDVMPQGGVLYLEGTSIVPEIQAFLNVHSAEETRRVVRGTIWPRAKTFHLPLAGSNVTRLRALAEGHAEPEICDHLVVYQGEQVLLTAYDAGSSDVYVSRDLSPETVEELRRHLGIA